MQTRQVLVFVIAVAIIALALGTTLGYSISPGKTSITTQTQTVTDTSSVVVIQSVTTTTTTSATEVTTSNVTLTTTALSYVPIGTQVSMNENSSVEIFVRYHFYNADKTVTISPSNTSLIYIWGSNYSADVSTANPNFTIRETSPITPLTIGGVDNESEGAIVAYEIQSAPISNGTYALGVNYLFPEVCAVEFLLIVGNGSPNYASQIMGGCIITIGENPSVIENQLLALVVQIDN